MQQGTEKQRPSAPPDYTANPTGPQYGFPVSNPGYPPPYSQSDSQYQFNYSQMPQPQVVQPTSVSNQTVIVMGGCPSCRVGVLEDNYTCCGICCAICFFPIGILCCLAMKEKKCTNCKATF